METIDLLEILMDMMRQDKDDANILINIPRLGAAMKVHLSLDVLDLDDEEEEDEDEEECESCIFKEECKKLYKSNKPEEKEKPNASAKSEPKKEQPKKPSAKAEEECFKEFQSMFEKMFQERYDNK